MGLAEIVPPSANGAIWRAGRTRSLAALVVIAFLLPTIAPAQVVTLEVRLEPVAVGAECLEAVLLL